MSHKDGREAMKLSANDMRVLHAMRNVLHPSRGGNGDFDGFMPHGSRDWIAIRRLLRDGYVKQSNECRTCQTCSEPHEDAMFTLTPSLRTATATAKFTGKTISDKYLTVRVVKEQPIPFNGEEVAPMFRGVIAEQREFLTGNKHVEVVSLSYERTESEAKRRAAALLRRWASDIEAVTKP